jgi:hypothetical protein
MNCKLDDVLAVLSRFKNENWTHVWYDEGRETFFLYRDEVDPETGFVERVGSVRFVKELIEELEQ